MRKPHSFALAPCLLVACGLVMPLQGAFSQDSSNSNSADNLSVRQRIKERWLARQQQRQQAAAPAPAAQPDGAAVNTPSARIDQPGDYRYTLEHNGLARTYRVHVPRSYNAAHPAPLLMAFHGGGGNMDHMASDENYGLISKSESAGFVVVFPNGYSKLPSGKFATWNAGKCCGDARDRKVDDVGFVRQILGELGRQVSIDRQRIYATGMSNGGMMAYRLACEMPDTFAAIAAVAGTDNTAQCAPANPIAILHIHARNDDRVLFDGGAGRKFGNLDQVTDFTSVPATVARWVAHNGCSASPQRTVTTNGATCERYANCQGQTRVDLCVTETGAHSWPGGYKARASEAPSQALSANDVMWDFFTARPTPEK